ncbi:MAG: virulence factor SrfB [Desulfovibrio sp.]|jgi:hypothetical protein|nr:virulence factor SrfB [Desulfovibrio sp.]
MPYSIPKYPRIVSLIPEATPQFLDFVFPLRNVEKDVRYFQEMPGVGEQSGKQVLRGLIENDDGLMLDEITGEQVRQGIFEIYAKRCLDPWLEHWLPVPFLRVRDQKWDDGNCHFERGPANWARVRLVRDSGDQEQLRVVLAFDMTVEDPPTDTDMYFAVSPSDVDAHANYALAVKIRDNAWFLNQAWVDDWLKNIWKTYQARRKGSRDEERGLEYLAGYLTLLGVIGKAIRDTAVQVVRPAQTPIDVDLVLDIGNSRTTGILVETRTQRNTDLNDSYLLQLRDIDSPEHVYMEPFETRLEFAEANFGDDNLSRQSGRGTPAFVWPSPARIGPEAARLSTQALCAEGITGMSSPKRYLWDERDWATGWRYNMRGAQEPRVTRGPLPRLLNQSGTPLCCMDDKLFRNNPVLRNQDTDIAFDSKFTRSSLMMFLLVELLQQALVTINSPGQRARRELPNVPRRLRQVIFTVPAAMPIAEQRIYRRWVNWAVRVLWDVLGWRDYYVPDHKKRALGGDYRLSPRVRCNWDEATCTQLVFVYNEIVGKYQGDAHSFARYAGTPRREYGGRPCLRLATIDIGGGTTDLSITTFEVANEVGSSSRLRPHLELRDGFTIAGDDIAREVIRSTLLPAISAAVTEAGVAHGEKLLASLFGREIIDNSQENRNRRAQCVRQLLLPAALSLLRVYETMDEARGGAGATYTLGDFFTDGRDAGARPLPFPSCPAPGEAALAYLAGPIRQAGAKADFDIMSVPIRLVPRNLDAVISEILGPPLANLCEVIQRYDCDALLLTGRPSRWRGILAAVLAKLPLPPDRVLPMSRYRVGAWYPFADVTGTISDPKTTVVVGGILCSLAEGHLEGFSFDPSGITPSSTARFIGEMDINGRIKKQKVWFEVDVTAREEKTYTREISFSNTITVGFRLLDADRWTTSRFYVLDFADEDARRASSGKTPYTVRLSLTLRELEEDETGLAAEDNERDEGEFAIEDIADRHGAPVKTKDLRMRLQTLPLDEGAWLDTGIVL